MSEMRHAAVSNRAGLSPVQSWIRPISTAIPWVTVLLLLLMLYMVGGTFTAAEGVLFDLPDAASADDEASGLVALVLPMPRETLVFFDDARYTLGDRVSTAAFGDHLLDRVSKVERKTLLVLADRRIAAGDLMKVAAIARKSGVERVLFAEKKQGEVAE